MHHPFEHHPVAFPEEQTYRGICHAVETGPLRFYVLLDLGLGVYHMADLRLQGHHLALLGESLLSRARSLVQGKPVAVRILGREEGRTQGGAWRVDLDFHEEEVGWQSLQGRLSQEGLLRPLEEEEGVQRVSP